MQLRLKKIGSYYFRKFSQGLIINRIDRKLNQIKNLKLELNEADIFLINR